MKEAADVRSIDALKHAKAALVDFREIVVVALSEAHAEVQRTLWWLQHDQSAHWKREVRSRSEKVAQAKSELYRAKLSAMDDHASCIEQKKMLERAERRLAEAQQKVQLVAKWARVMEREMMLYKGQCQPIARAVEVEMPRGEGRLDQIIDRLEAYILTKPPQTTDARPTSEGVDETGSST